MKADSIAWGRPTNQQTRPVHRIVPVLHKRRVCHSALFRQPLPPCLPRKASKLEQILELSSQANHQGEAITSKRIIMQHNYAIQSKCQENKTPSRERQDLKESKIQRTLAGIDCAPDRRADANDKEFQSCQGRPSSRSTKPRSINRSSSTGGDFWSWARWRSLVGRPGREDCANKEVGSLGTWIGL